MSSDSAAVETPGELIKTDRLGRIKVKPEYREALLDKFEQSGMSGIEFSKVHGIKYPTFANWRQLRRVRLDQYPRNIPGAPCELMDSLAEVVVQSGSPELNPHPSASLQIDLGGGVSLNIKEEADLKLAAKLINQLRSDVSL